MLIFIQSCMAHGILSINIYNSFRMSKQSGSMENEIGSPSSNSSQGCYIQFTLIFMKNTWDILKYQLINSRESESLGLGGQPVCIETLNSESSCKGMSSWWIFPYSRWMFPNVGASTPLWVLLCWKRAHGIFYFICRAVSIHVVVVGSIYPFFFSNFQTFFNIGWKRTFLKGI